MQNLVTLDTLHTHTHTHTHTCILDKENQGIIAPFFNLVNNIIKKKITNRFATVYVKT